MFVLRRDQLDHFHRQADRRFLDEMVEHLKDFAPRLFEIVGETGIRQVVQMGMKRAEGYGLTNRGPTRFYIELMFSLGSDFDTDRQLPWARRILGSRSVMSQASRADILYRGMTEYFKEVAGPQNVHAIAALRRINQGWVNELQSHKRDNDDQIVASLKAVYPEKSAYLGDAILRALIREGAELSKFNGIDTDSGRSLLIGLMFGFGHGITSDSLYPWVAHTLHSGSVHDSNARVQRLFKKTKTYVEHMLQHLS